MKTTIKTKSILAAGLLMALPLSNLLAQDLADPLRRGGAFGDRFGFTSNIVQTNIKAIGVGQFTITNPPSAALHIDANLLAPVTSGYPNFFLPGEVFRTTATDANLNAWRMFTGTGNGTEKFSLFVPATSSNITLQATQFNGNMIFNTGGANERMRITPTGFVGVNIANPDTQLHAIFDANRATEVFPFVADYTAKIENAEPTGNNNVALYSLVSGGKAINAAGVFSATTLSGDDPAQNFGIATFASSGDVQTGNFGIYAFAPINANSYAGFFDGNIYATSISGTGGNQITSDVMFKKDVLDINNALSIINQLSPKTFYYKTTDFGRLNFSNKLQYGLVAQDVEAVLPELVDNKTIPSKLDEFGNEIDPAINYKSLNYNAFIGILIAGMQEQQATIENLNARIEQLESETGGIPPQSGNNFNSALKNEAILYQNTPNPFTNETTINYYLPENTQKAEIVLYDSYGKAIKTINLTAKGNGNTVVTLSSQADGIYSYSLVIDGKVNDAKKMMKQ